MWLSLTSHRLRTSSLLLVALAAALCCSHCARVGISKSQQSGILHDPTPVYGRIGYDEATGAMGFVSGEQWQRTNGCSDSTARVV